MPELVPGYVREADAVRGAACEAADWLHAGSTRWLAVAAHEHAASYEPPVCGSFAGYGAHVAVSLGARTDGSGECDGTDTQLPLPVLVTAWLRGQVGAFSAEVELLSAATAPSDCVRLGERLCSLDEQTGLLVLGDGSTRRGDGAPGGAHPDAERFDSDVAAALAHADADRLRALDPVESAELGAIGRAPWQVAAGVADAGVPADGGEQKWRAEPLYSAAPFGVGYHVVLWERV